MKETILFSIIMPVFNRKNIVGSSIESVLKQTYSNWELLLVDDCSTDGTAEHLEKIAAMDERVHIFHTPVNSGPSTARNIETAGSAEHDRADSGRSRSWAERLHGVQF